MLLATSLSPIASSAATNDIQFDPPPLVSLTPSSPFSQEDIHSIRQSHTCPTVCRNGVKIGINTNTFVDAKLFYVGLPHLLTNT